MKKLLDELYKDMDIELQKSPDLRVQQLIELEENLDSSIQEFEGKLAQDQIVAWDEVKAQVGALSQYARVAKLRLLMNDEQMRVRIEEMRSQESEEDEEFQEAQLEVERDMHQPKGIIDVFKALLMYRDNPEEKIAKKKAE